MQGKFLIRTLTLAAAFLPAVAAIVTIAPPVAGQPAILADGVVESTMGGFKFPDGSIQETAAGGGDPCPTLDPSDEMIEVGGVCIDKYEASIWDAPVGGNQITGALPCSFNGQDCDNIWARSVAGVMPRHGLSWFQAQAALTNSGKRLPTNAEWQMAARGTPDPGTTPGSEDCNTTSVAGTDLTGERENCVSHWGAFDMVGNVQEWVADWVPDSTTCPGWGGGGAFNDDTMCLSGASATTQAPSALVRGGAIFGNGLGAGVFAVTGTNHLYAGWNLTGFRGAR